MDLDVRAVFRRPDGTLASLDEARHDPLAVARPRAAVLPQDSLDKMRRMYEKTRVEHYYGFNQSGHTMDYVLRQGETFTRWWTPQGGRWNHRLEWNREAWLRQLIEQPPRGPKPNHRDFSDPQPWQRAVRLPARPQPTGRPTSPTGPTTPATCGPLPPA